jgi:demethylmenaquinone methyltransferase/2-methoxy-6-polyprenyl-1,4-benzoquinol methylase
MTTNDTSGEGAGDSGENAAPDPATADFGYRRVPASEKAGLVRGVFDSVAGRYDLMNDLMSGGLHRLWKAALLDRLNPRPGERFLDVAGGTGDIARGIRRRAGAHGGAAARIILCDINAAMLTLGRDRAIDANILTGIDYIVGDAEALPIASGTVDAYTIAFGLRNVTHIEAALREARRVLKPGGRLLCLEFSHVAPAVLARAYDLYSFNFLPALGQIVTGEREAYRYLVESIRRFPPQQELAAMMRAAGLDQVRFRDLTFGVAAIHSGWRL